VISQCYSLTRRCFRGIVDSGPVMDMKVID
jgi:hypothetical protein